MRGRLSVWGGMVVSGATVVPVLAGMAAAAADYDALILDLWGVVHDGVAAYPGVRDCLARLRAAEKRVVILSNAPRRAHHAVERLRHMGIGDGLYERIITSGDATRQALGARSEPGYAALGASYFFLGKEADADLLDGLDYRRAAALEEADFLLVTGPAAESTQPADYEALLRRAVGLGLLMVCANPDLAVIRGGQREPCAGAFAERYAELGGAVRAHGKPHPEVFDLCLEALGGVARERVLVVGDGLETDIAGAHAAGLDSLLVTGGLLAHAWGVPSEAPPDPARLAAACSEAGVTPAAAIATFTW